MKALLISLLVIVACASAVTGISKSLAEGEIRGERTPLTAVRNTSDPFILVASLKSTFAR